MSGETAGIPAWVARSSRSIAGRVVRSRRSAAHQTRRGATSNGSRRGATSNGGTAHTCCTHSGAKRTAPAAGTTGQRKSHGDCGYQEGKNQTSRITNDHGALLSVDPEINNVGLL